MERYPCWSSLALRFLRSPVISSHERPAFESGRCAYCDGKSMKIRAHSESHLVELDDGSRWRIFPGDLDVTLNWRPDTELKLVRIGDEASSHALVSLSDNSSVRVLAADESWPVKEVKDKLSEG